MTQNDGISTGRHQNAVTSAKRELTEGVFVPAEPPTDAKIVGELEQHIAFGLDVRRHAIDSVAFIRDELQAQKSPVMPRGHFGV